MKQLSMVNGKPFKISSLIKDPVFMPGTKGFISLIQGPDYKNPNIVFLKAVVIRRGVSGKNRIDSNMLLCPIFKSKLIKNKNLMFPKKNDEVEYKYLVDLNESRIKCIGSVVDKNYMPHIDFMGWLLSKTLLLKALDSVVYESINKTLGIYEKKVNKMWKPKEESLLSEFTHILRNQLFDGNFESLINSFCTKTKRVNLVSELYDMEVKLAVPMIEYTKRVASVMSGAHRYMTKEIANDKKANGLLETVKIPSQKDLNSILKTRLNSIAKNRKIVQM